MPRIIISANKTTRNPGKTLNNKREVDITRDIVKNIVPHLRSSGVLTLSTPKELETDEKIEWINRTGYSAEHNDIAIDVHLNQGDGSKSGSIGWYSKKDGDKSKKLVDEILASISSDTKLSSQGSFKEDQHPNKKIDFLSKTKPISIIVGAAFLDNKNDIDFILNDKNLEELGTSIAKGILKYLNVDFKESKIKPSQNSFSSIQSNQSPSFPPSFPSPSTSGGNSGSGSYLASREERKEMIKKYYTKILGREPNQSDLNYFLNTGINEEQLMKKMIDSQEHADLVKSRQEILTTKAQFHSMQAELLMLRATNDDKAELINNLNSLIAQKNIALTQMNKKIQFYESSPNKRSKQDPAITSGNSYKKSFTDKLLGFFSDRLG
jgi:hypothetical protein